MQAVLYVCHGSRMKEACEQARFFVNECMKQVDAPIQEVCFLELAAPSIAQGFRACIEKGASRIAVVPVLLLAAAHAKQDIPAELGKLQKQYPHIHVTYGEPFGVHESIIPILLERIEEKRIGDNAMVLLVGRGSSDPDVKRDMQQIADLLQESYPFQTVEVSFLAAAHPTFEEGLHRALSYGYKQIFVVPYLLFTGILMRGMEKTIRKLDRKELILCPYLGYHSNLQRVLAQRADEAIRSDGYVSHFSTHCK
ncbi:MAG: sirohydrochlorin chelatase [Ectobacillus sp.]